MCRNAAVTMNDSKGVAHDGPFHLVVALFCSLNHHS